MNNLLEVRGLRKTYRDFSLQDIGFKLEKGYIMGFIGPNGAGKSTTIKLIMNLLKKEAGEIKIFGLDNRQAEKQVKNRIGFVYDENHYYDELNILQMKKVVAPFYSKWDDAVFHRYLREFELPTGKKIKELSKGMKMKFALAVAFAHQAELIIMDEPTGGLDPIVRSELLEILAGFIQDEQKGVFFSTHITTDLDRIADFVTFINNGQIVFSCSRENLLDNYALVKGGKECLSNEVKKHFVGLRENKFGFEALTKDKKTISGLLAGKIVLEKPTLDDIMLYTVRRELHA